MALELWTPPCQYLIKRLSLTVTACKSFQWDLKIYMGPASLSQYHRKPSVRKVHTKSILSTMMNKMGPKGMKT